MYKYMMALLCTTSIISAAIEVDLDFLLQDCNSIWKLEKSVVVEEGEERIFCSEEYRLSMVVRCCGDNKVKGNFQLSRNGEIMSSPCIEGFFGQKMGIELSEDTKASNMLAILFSARKK